MGSINQKKALKFLEKMLESFESTTEEKSIETNPRGLLMLLYVERVADYLGGYPDMPGKGGAKKDKSYKELEMLRSRIAQLAQRVPQTQRAQILKDFNDTTVVTSMIGGSNTQDESGDNRSSKEFADEWLEKHSGKK